MAVIAMLNQKGGVGKTTLTANLGGAWVRLGRRILLVDNDPQASLTQGVLGPEATAGLHPDETIASVYMGTAVAPGQAVVKTNYTGLELMAGSRYAAAYNNGSAHDEPWHLQTCLREAVDALRGDYDHVLIDCPPNLNLCSWAALAASDAVLVPVQPEDYGAQGLPDVLRSVGAVAEHVNPDIRLLGLVISMHQPRRSVHQLYVEKLRAMYGGDVFDVMIAAAAEVAESTMLRRPVCWYKPKGAVAKTLLGLAAEADRRIGSWSAAGGEAA